MADSQQTRVQKAVEDMVQSLEKDHIRVMQVVFIFLIKPKK